MNDPYAAQAIRLISLGQKVLDAQTIKLGLNMFCDEVYSEAWHNLPSWQRDDPYKTLKGPLCL